MTTDLQSQIDFLRTIIRANKLHEPLCPAFTTGKGEFGGMFQGMAEKYCDCFISRSNPETDPAKGFGLFNIKEDNLVSTLLFRSRADAVDHLVDNYHLSRDKRDENYYQKQWYVVEAQAKSVEAPPTHFGIWNKGETRNRANDMIFFSRQEAINYLTEDSSIHVDHPMADKYWGHSYDIREIKD